jgi:hypothetical protein
VAAAERITGQTRGQHDDCPRLAFACHPSHFRGERHLARWRKMARDDEKDEATPGHWHPMRDA